MIRLIHPPFFLSILFRLSNSAAFPGPGSMVGEGSRRTVKDHEIASSNLSLHSAFPFFYLSNFFFVVCPLFLLVLSCGQIGRHRLLCISLVLRTELLGGWFGWGAPGSKDGAGAGFAANLDPSRHVASLLLVCFASAFLSIRCPHLPVAGSVYILLGGIEWLRHGFKAWASLCLLWKIGRRPLWS
ncbi:hypothetical protein VTI28DRAFT_6246 [Corynascus sepedonium]